MKPILRTSVTLFAAVAFGFGLCLLTTYRPRPKAEPITSPAKQHNPEPQVIMPQLTYHPDPPYTDAV